MNTSRYAVFRYQVKDEDEGSVHAESHFGSFEGVWGKKAPYRVRDPETNDFENFIFDLQSVEKEELKFFYFGVGYQITEKPEHQFDPNTGKVQLVMRDANDMRYTRGVFLPGFQVAAFKEGSGDFLSATGGIGRVASIFDYHVNTISTTS